MSRYGFLALALFLLFASSAFSEAVRLDQFQQGNHLYREGKYLDAANVYEGLVENKLFAELYYNLGNAYFKAGKPGLAVLNYERALNLNPRDRDILANLSYVTRLIEYKIEDKRNWYQRKVSQLLRLVTFDECMFISFLAYFVFMAGLVIHLAVKKVPLFEKAGRLALVFVILCSLPLLLKYAESGAGKRGIVTDLQTEVRYGPSGSDRIAFRLAEGLEVILDDEKEDWYRIRLRDGRSGWAVKTEVTAI
jgi:tetratricopeptide (TPR) repeat protein